MASGAAVANQGRGKYPVVDALNRDWSVLADRHRGLVARWALRDEAFIDCVSLDDVLFAVQLRPDAVLRALLTEVSKGDELAGRVVLQAMIGRMVRMAIRDPKASIDEYISALWCQIQNYPLASRPNRVAANLSMDTFKSLRREQRWLLHYEILQWPPQMFVDELGSGTEATLESRRHRGEGRCVGPRHSSSWLSAQSHRLRDTNLAGEHLSRRARSSSGEPSLSIHSRCGAGALQSSRTQTRRPCS